MSLFSAGASSSPLPEQYGYPDGSELPVMFYKKESQQETLRLRLNSC
jgi:hypothetical protein